MKIKNIKDQTFLEKMMEKVREVYLEESKRIVESHKIEMEKELDNLMDEIVTRAGLRIEERITLDRFGQEIRITIFKDSK